jgi:hypothetical protein
VCVCVHLCLMLQYLAPSTCLKRQHLARAGHQKEPPCTLK